MIGWAIVGTCGLCNGPVRLPTVWHGIVEPDATCADCGATAKRSYGPVIPMDPPARIVTSLRVSGDS